MIKSIKIEENTFNLSNSIGVLKVYKDHFKKPWHQSKNDQIAAELKANAFSRKYINLTDEMFDKLPQEEKDDFYRQLSENEINNDFMFDTIFAMAVTGGYTGTQQELENAIPATELNENGELMKIVNQFILDLSGIDAESVKKKIIMMQQK